jgi:DeoR/GlpR family transcriptional regulator of sugar metabolism
MGELLKEERQQLILETIQNGKKATVLELSRRFGLSAVTIRRDLSELAQAGKIRRTHRGALLAPPASGGASVIQRMAIETAAKTAIGRAAAALVQPGEAVFISSGSTTTFVARSLAQRSGLTIVTNALNIAAEMAGNPGITLVVAGGLLRASELSLIGHITELALREVRVDKVILGIPALSLEAGLTNDYLPEVMTDRTILQLAPELILVADHTKFGKTLSAYLAPLERVSILVTDSRADPDFLADLRARGLKAIAVDPII